MPGTAARHHKAAMRPWVAAESTAAMADRPSAHGRRRRGRDTERRRLLLSLVLALLAHALLVLVTWTARHPVPQRQSPTLFLDLQPIKAAQPEPMEAVPETPAELPPEVLAPAPLPLAAEPPLPQPEAPPAPAAALDPTPLAAPVVAPDGGIRWQALDDRFDRTGRDRAPSRQYGELASLYRPPTVRYRPTAFDPVWVPDGHAGQVAAFHYPILNVLHIFPQLSWLISAPPPTRRDCLRHAEGMDEGICVDAGETAWQRLQRRTWEH
jgi:hypothetical protein